MELEPRQCIRQDLECLLKKYYVEITNGGALGIVDALLVFGLLSIITIAPVIVIFHQARYSK